MGAPVTAANNFCNQLQVFFEGSATNRMGKYGLLQGLMSEENRKPDSKFDRVQTYVDEGGKGHVIGLYERYYQRESGPVLTAGADGEPDSCTPGTANPERQKEFAFNDDRYFYKEVVLSAEEMRYACEEKSWDGWMNDKIGTVMHSLYNGIDAAMVSRFEALRGKFYDNTLPSKSAPLFDGSGNPLVTNLALPELMRNEGIRLPNNTTGKLIVVGSGQFASYLDLLNQACCNDKGVNMVEALKNFYYFYDQNVPTALAAADDLIAFEPGQCELVTYNWNRGQFKAMEMDDRRFWDYLMGNGNVLRTEFVDTRTFDGMPVRLDVNIGHTNCKRSEEQYKISIGAYFDLWTLDADAFKATDELYEMNFLYRFTAA